VKGEAATFSVRAQRCQSHYFSATPRTSQLLKKFHYVITIYKFAVLRKQMMTMIAGVSCMTLAVANSIPVDKKPKVPPEFSKD
jgi:hypothetical protein